MTLRRLVPLCAALLSFTTEGLLLHAQKQAVVTGRVAAAEPVSFDVYLPHQNREALEALLTEQHTPGSANYHKWLTPQQFQSRFGVSTDKVQAIRSELAAYGLSAQQTSPHRLQITGSASQVQSAFHTTLQTAVKASGQRTMVAASSLSLPRSLEQAGATVLAFNGKERMRHDFHVVTAPNNRYSQAGGYWFDDLKQAYGWPSYKVATGAGVTIAVLVDGGLRQRDEDIYFQHEKINSPKITVENVAGGSAFDPNDGGSYEAALDIQQSGGMAPGAHIILYSLPDLYDSSVVGGLIQIVEENQADVVNMSFGGPELFYTAAYNGGVDYTGILRVEDDLFAEGNALGITFVASSGDFGAAWVPPVACFEPNAKTPCGALLPSVNFPASSPHVTGVGGTNLGTVTHPNHPTNLDSTYLYEEAFGDPLGTDAEFGTTATGAYWGSGGGDSVVFAKPAFQKLITTGSKVRAVPDVALHMGGCPGIPGAICTPEDSYDIAVVGNAYVGLIGTSASSPDFAGLTALNIQLQKSRLGNENSYIYALAAAQAEGIVQNVYRNTIPGYNNVYTSGNGGYNRVLGVGTPVGKNFLLLPNAPAAGVPQSPSNP